jgi:hypothetical protein
MGSCCRRRQCDCYGRTWWYQRQKAVAVGSVLVVTAFVLKRDLPPRRRNENPTALQTLRRRWQGDDIGQLPGGHVFQVLSAAKSAMRASTDSDMRAVEMETDDSEMSYRRGYQEGATETFRAVERFLNPATREALRAWIEEDVYGWRVKAMLGYPPLWRLRILSDPKGN